jgi:hypothetical protein
MHCAEHPGIKFGEVAKTASELWKQLDESERMRCGLDWIGLDWFGLDWFGLVYLPTIKRTC